jgi:hypothetical protein
MGKNGSTANTYYLLETRAPAQAFFWGAVGYRVTLSGMAVSIAETPRLTQTGRAAAFESHRV